MILLFDRLNFLIKRIGEVSSWLNLFLVFIICLDVLQRYVLNTSYNWILELEWQVFGLVFLLGSAYTFQMDKHVRVDIFYNSFTEKWRNLIDVLGTLLLLIPWCLMGIVTCYNYASNSFYIRECSPNPGGLPAWYLIKFMVVISFVLLMLQGIIVVIQKVKKI